MHSYPSYLRSFQGSSELFEAYIALIRAALDAKLDLRQRRTISYDDAVAASRQKCERAVLLAQADFNQATERCIRGNRRQAEISQEELNQEITAANRAYQLVEAPVFASIATPKDLRELARRREALVFASGELGCGELAEEADRQYEEARCDAFAARDAALAEARAAYQRDISAMHRRHQERLRLYQSRERQFVTPFAAVRDRLIAQSRQEHERSVAKEKQAAEHDLAAIEHVFWQDEQERLAELGRLLKANFSAESCRRFLDYCERYTQLLKERTHSF